jgi:hypothetical protein
MRTREQHLQWCKDTAMKYWRDGDLENACGSMVSDLAKHPETKDMNWAILSLGMIYVCQRDYDGMRRWIEGFR